MKENRTYNFNPGPAALPFEVLAVGRPLDRVLFRTVQRHQCGQEQYPIVGHRRDEGDE